MIDLYDIEFQMRRWKFFSKVIIILVVLAVAIVIAGNIFNFDLTLEGITSFLGLSVSKEKILKEADYWGIDVHFANEGDFDKLENSNFDVIVVGLNDVTKGEIKTLQDNRKRLVMAYFPVGQVYKGAWYWEPTWDEEIPDWFEEVDESDKDKYNIEYWRKSWKTILYGSKDSFLDQITAKGFDGVYVDISGIEYWDGKDDGAASEMVEIIEDISAYARDRNFLIVLENATYFEGSQRNRIANNIDSVSFEGLYYGYDGRLGLRTPESLKKKINSRLDYFKQKDLPIFLLDYPLTCEKANNKCLSRTNVQRMQEVYEGGWRSDFIPYSHVASLSGVLPALPKVTQIQVQEGSVPIITWNSVSANTTEPTFWYRIFISSSMKRLENNEPDIFDSGKRYGGGIFDFVPDKPINEGTYYFKIAVFEYVDSKQLISPWSEVAEIEYKKVVAPETDMAPTSTVEMGWIPNWGFVDGFESLKAQTDTISSVSPVWFEVNSDGSLEQLSTYNDKEFIDFCKENNITLVPSIGLFDADAASEVLNRRLDTHVQAIYEETKHYQGIDIDYEAILKDDEEEFFRFLKLLSKKLHANDRILSVTVHSKWSDSEVYGWRPQTRSVQDWEKIAEYADEIRIMAYDYTGQTQYIPGPLSPIYWDELILSYAVEKVDPEKIVLALPLYGYSFIFDEKSILSTDIWEGGDIAGNESRIYAYTWEDIRGLEKKYEMVQTYDEFWQELIIRYSDDSSQRVLFIFNEDSLNARKDLAKEYGIKGISYWRLGGDLQ